MFGSRGAAEAYGAKTHQPLTSSANQKSMFSFFSTPVTTNKKAVVVELPQNSSVADSSRLLQPTCVLSTVAPSSALSKHRVSKKMQAGDSLRRDVNVRLSKQSQSLWPATAKRLLEQTAGDDAASEPNPGKKKAKKDYVARCSNTITQQLYRMGGGDMGITKAIKMHVDGRPENRILNWEGVVDKKQFAVMRAVMARAKFCCGFQPGNDEAGQPRKQGIYVTKGSRTVLNENNMVAGLYMIIPPDVTDRKLAREYSRQLGISTSRVTAIAKLSKKMEDLAVTDWKLVQKGTYRNKIPSEVDRIIVKWLHGDVASRIDNNRKTPAKIYSAADKGETHREYEQHDYRVLRGDAEFLWRLFTGRNRDGEEDLGPTQEFRQILALTTYVKRPNGIKGGANLIRRNICKCLKWSTIARCVCTLCWTAIQNLGLFHRARNGLWASHDVFGTGTNKCNCPDGVCGPGSLYRKFSSDIDTACKSLMCGREVVPGLGLPALDPMTGRELGPETVREVSMHKQACHRLDRVSPCGSCGWSNIFSNLPVVCVEYTGDANSEPAADTVHACSIEASPKRPFVWNAFRKTEHGKNKLGKVVYQTDWVPIPGNWAQFLCFLRDSLEKYIRHIWGVEWTNLTHRRQSRILMYRQAFGTAPSTALGTATAQIDFAARLTHTKPADVTCSFAETSHEHVAVIGHSPYLKTFSEEEINRRWKRNRGVASAVLQKVTVCFSLSKRKADTTYHGTVTALLVHILRHGCLPERPPSDVPGPEAFWRGNRLKGSDTKHKLAPGSGLVEAPSEMPNWPLLSELLRLLVNRDGCGAQFQGKNNFLADQTFEARTQCKLVDQKEQSQHGKGTADGFSNVPKHALKGATRRGVNIGSGTRNLVLFLANDCKTPTRDKKTKWWSADDYIWMYIPEEHFDSKPFTTTRGVKDSSKMHFWVGRGKTLGTSELAYREGICSCTPCVESMDLISADCEMTALVGKRKTTRLVQATEPRRMATRATSTIESLAKWLPCNRTTKALERVVVFRVHPLDPNPLKEAYFLGRPVRAAYQLPKDGTLAGSKHVVGEWVTKVKWFELESVHENGDRVYSLKKLPSSGEVFVVKGIVNLRFVSFYKHKSTRGGRYFLARSMHQRILQDGDLDAN